jgi:hypothetical protein
MPSLNYAKDKQRMRRSRDYNHRVTGAKVHALTQKPKLPGRTVLDPMTVIARLKARTC